MRTNHDPDDLVERLAYAVVKPGGKALLLDAENKALVDQAGRPRWVTITEAGRLGNAFAVDVADEILAFDCDKPDLAGVVDALAAEMRAQGYRPVLTDSGRPGHRHLLARIDSPPRKRW